MSYKIPNKVLHLRSSGAFLGAENVVIEIAKNSYDYNITPIIGAINNIHDPRPVFIDAAVANGLEVVRFLYDGFLGLNCSRAIKEYVNQHNVNLLHVHGYKEDFVGLLSRSPVPIVATNHLWKKNNIKLKAYRLFDIMLLHLVDQVVGVSDELVYEMQRFGIRNVMKIPNGVDIERFKVKPKSIRLMDKFCIYRNTVVFGMISSLTPEKNHRVVVNCLAHLHHVNFKLLIVGDGPEKSSLQSLVKERGLQQYVIFTGSQENIPEILSIIDVYLLPSFAEGLPISLLEAMAAGKAVIASRVGEIPNILKHKENGFLINPNDMNALKVWLEYLLKRRDLIPLVGLRARRTVETNYSSNSMARNYCSLYQRILDVPI